MTTTEKTRTAVPVDHEVRNEWQYSAFFLAECICGKKMFATERRELIQKWKEHLDA